MIRNTDVSRTVEKELEPLLIGCCLDTLPMLAAKSVQTCITSPPYFGLRDYGVQGQIGREETPAEFVATMVRVFAEVHRVLSDDGTLWLNLGDSYAANRRGGKHKDLIGIPWRVAFALQEAGWYLRQDIIWHKPNPMPESVTDRCTKSHEYLFLLSKSPRYYFDHEAIKEPTAPSTRARLAQNLDGQCGSNRVPGKTNGRMKAVGHTDRRSPRSVWTVPTQPFKGAHFATFPRQLIEPCVLAGSRRDDTVLDPFMGAGTTAVVAERHGRKWIGCELNPTYADLALDRIAAARK